MSRFFRPLILVMAVCVLAMADAHAARKSDIRATKHNLSSSQTSGTHSTVESQVCVFCHTPHGANTTMVSPLWNRRVGGASNTSETYAASYTPYDSSSLDAKNVAGAWSSQPLGSSKLCLSCHDGTIALGNVVNAPGSGLGAASASGFGRDVESGAMSTTTMPVGSGAASGYTRLLGTDLANDHPISVTYNKAVADADGELRTPDAATQVSAITASTYNNRPVFGPKTTGSSRPVLPLERTGSGSPAAGQVQCTTCHDPHLTDTDTSAEFNIKFLRLNRLQRNNSPTNAGFSDANDIICLACHNKGDLSWAYSAHANELVSTQRYTGAATTERQFPANIKVWQVACLNCHDTHTVSGARRLLRAGVSGALPALEETCYQCHRPVTSSILQDAAPDIRTDFTGAGNYHMPIASADQKAGSEQHDITSAGEAGGVDCSTNKCGADMVESRAKLGLTAANRHAECTDCHNPHRVVKFQRFDNAGTGLLAGSPGSKATHEHRTDSTAVHTNIASGVLRGSWGVEPQYTTGNASFQLPAASYTIRRGDPGGGKVTYNANAVHPADSETFVTREYQVCLKCHSSYAYGTTPPDLETSHATGLTAKATNDTTPTATSNLVTYTDQAKEFQAPTTHKKDKTQAATTDSGAAATYQTNNHRSWHPVMGSTGRTVAERATGADSIPVANFNHPFQNVGTQTMYCSDCHGSLTANGTVVPSAAVANVSGGVWGPHGSTQPFILKGPWNVNSKSNDSDLLCYKCHRQSTYSGATEARTGFYLTDVNKDGHALHRDRITGNVFRCSYCHVAVPHGWKNKALLVNLNDVGPEVGEVAGTEKRINTSTPYSKAPYYMKAKNKIKTFAKSGNWQGSNCGSKGGTGDGGGAGKDWMKGGTESCKTLN